MTLYIGMDIHSKKTNYICIDSEGNVIEKNSIATTENQVKNFAKRMLEKDIEVIAAMETGTQASWMYKKLTACGLNALIIPAQHVNAISRHKKQKNDSNDAVTICHGIRTGIFTQFVYVPDEPIEVLRKLISLRSHFVDLIVAEINAVKAYFRSDGDTLSKTLRSENSWNELLKIPEAQKHKMYLDMHHRVYTELSNNVKELEKKIKESLKGYSQWYEILESIPGVGLITAATIIATIVDINRFPDSHHFASYCGVVPSTYDSGTKKVNGHITKNGSPLIRKYVCEAAQKARSREVAFSYYFYNILKRRGHQNIAIVAVGHLILRVAYQMLKTGKKFDPGMLGLSQKIDDKTGECIWVKMESKPETPDAIKNKKKERKE